MKLTINKINYRVNWEHKMEFSNDTKRVGGSTLCLIQKDEELLPIGIANVHPNDNYSKAIGRKQSLSKALLSLPKEIRKNFWDLFLNKKY